MFVIQYFLRNQVEMVLIMQLPENLNITEITLVLRWLVVFLALLIAQEAWRIFALLENVRLSRIVGKIYKTFLFFGIARFVASLLDNYLDYGIGIFSNIVNDCFFIWIFLYFRRQRLRLKSDSFTPDSRRRISTVIDELLDELSLEKEKLGTQ